MLEPSKLNRVDHSYVIYDVVVGVSSGGCVTLSLNPNDEQKSVLVTLLTPREVDDLITMLEYYKTRSAGEISRAEN